MKDHIINELVLLLRVKEKVTRWRREGDRMEETGWRREGDRIEVEVT